MKRILPLLLVLVAFSTQAQNFRPVKFNLSLGYAKPTGSGASGGILASLEPKYGVNDQLDLGLRIELAAMARAYILNGQNTEGEFKAASSYLATGTYLLSQTGFRPYVGVGVGLFTTAGTSLNSNSSTGNTGGSIAVGNKFGGMVRAGFKTGHFNLGLEYNLVPPSKGVLIGSNGLSTNYESANTYFSLKLGVDIGGGPY
ncbi:hypothetical protein HNV11_10635 [Spirosoma taeanense]|uniref:Outer membrane protein beta-barrel domain-containing protein n=1 Tax=Spirosoma taeanense TaxID=2735870 RepID=A0A6M5Y9A0_9BACT|nr:hypothetical protein [Spirosoma taeanense]QJW89801.1 hypothetical protein HNV11_10635 [Spirosoma taeanense]